MPKEKTTDHHEEGTEVPYDQLAPETLRRMIQEFVTRDGADWAETGCTLEEKVEIRTKELAQSVDELKALGEISKTVSSTLDLEKVLIH